MTLDGFLLSYENALRDLHSTDAQVLSSTEALNKLLDEQQLLELSKTAIEQARPLVNADSIRQVEALMNSALRSIFDIDGTIFFDPESKHFLLQQNGFNTDLVEGCGGGILTAISFILDIFLLVKSGSRRVMFYDEAFTQVSENYFPQFMEFVRNTCHALNVDLMLITHDQRIDDSMVDHSYEISNGTANKTK